VFGLDDFLASLSDGTSLAVVAAVAILLGLRHATDPDHLAAVSTLLVSAEHRGRAAARLGAAWGAGHAATLSRSAPRSSCFAPTSRKPSSGARRRPSGS
jgi:high-affinity nickel permease